MCKTAQIRGVARRRSAGAPPPFSHPTHIRLENAGIPPMPGYTRGLYYADKAPVKIQRANEKDDLNSWHDTTVSHWALVIHLCFLHPPL